MIKSLMPAPEFLIDGIEFAKPSPPWFLFSFINYFIIFSPQAECSEQLTLRFGNALR